MNVKRRITLHFFTQLVMTFVATFLIMVLLMLLVIYLMTKDELKSNPQKAIVENLPYSIDLRNSEEVVLDQSWRDLLQKNEMWVQVVNRTGKVIYAFNTPDGFKNSYTMNELLLIEKTNQLDAYTIDTFFETWEPEPYYFLFGYMEKQQQMLRDWYDAFSSAGLVEEVGKETLEKEMDARQGLLEVYQDGKLVDTIGRNNSASLDLLDVVGRIHVPGNYDTRAFVVNDESTNSTWVYYEVNGDYEEQFIRLFPNTELETLFFVMLGSLIIPIVLAFWNGYRYGKPLLLLTSWLKIVERQQYEDILSGKEYKRIYKKNGKVKMRYRLYKEVFESISDMSDKLALAERERKQLEKTREEWMAGISHDLRTPLSSIQGYGHLLESGQYEYTKEELQQMGQVIRDKSDYMVDLVNDFSLVFQLKNSAVTIQKERIDLNEFIRCLVDQYKDDFTLASHPFTFEPSAQSCEVEIDPKWFARVIDNLLSNAVKHNPPQTKVHVKVVCESGETVIRIADDGKGMDALSVDHLFTRYYRGTSTNERAEGEGLGMSIAYAIVELHGGTIDVQSEMGKGTTVSIKL